MSSSSTPIRALLAAMSASSLLNRVSVRVSVLPLIGNDFAHSDYQERAFVGRCLGRCNFLRFICRHFLFGQ